MRITLPDIPPLQHLSEDEIKQELALALYGARKITLIQAADMAGRNLFDFQALLRDRQIPQHYEQHDLETDLLALRELGAK